MPVNNATSKQAAGFTLLEVMITVAIVGILAAIALPSYSYYITRSRIIEATTALGDVRSQMEKYFMDNRTYDGGGTCGVETLTFKPITSFNANPSRTFTLGCALGATPQTQYTLTATGIGPMAGFVYTVDQTNKKVTSAVPAGWVLPGGDCWAIRKDGTCG